MGHCCRDRSKLAVARVIGGMSDNSNRFVFGWQDQKQVAGLFQVALGLLN